MPTAVMLEDHELEWLIKQCRLHTDVNGFHESLLRRLEEACKVSRLLHGLKEAPQVSHSVIFNDICHF
jgi:hypothetical protein